MQSELKPCYLLMKRGLYYAPDRQGYTGVKARAGRYRAIDGLGLDGVTAVHEDDADEFSPACWPDTKEAVLRAEITRLTEALRAAEEREKGLRGIVNGFIELVISSGLTEDLVAQVFPDMKRKNGQPASTFAKNARRMVNEARQALAGATR